MRYCLIVLFSFSSILLSAQCEIPDLNIEFCSNNEVLDLTFYESNQNGTYQYSDGVNEIDDPTQFEPSGSAVLSVSFTENGTGCQSNFIIALEEIAAPEITFNSYAAISCINVGIDLIVMEDLNPNVVYSWYYSGDLLTSGTSHIFVEEPGIYTVTAESLETSCSAIDSVEVIADYDSPTATLDYTLNCDGTAIIEATPSDQGPNLVYFWYGPGITSSQDTTVIQVNSTGVYYIEILDINNGCINTIPIEISSLDCLDAVSVLNRNADLLVYPNPFVNNLSIADFPKDAKIFLYNSLGIPVAESTSHQGFQNLEELPKGIYYLTIPEFAFLKLQPILKL